MASSVRLATKQEKKPQRMATVHWSRVETMAGIHAMTKTNIAAINVTTIPKNVPDVMAIAADPNGATKKARTTGGQTRDSINHGSRLIVATIPTTPDHASTAVLIPTIYVVSALGIPVAGKTMVRRKLNLSGWTHLLKSPADLLRPKKTFNAGGNE
jgi:hypothetical protein